MAIQSRNASDLELKAHTLKGAVSNFYAKRVSLLASKLEVHGKENDMNGVEDAFVELKASLDALVSELKKVIDEKAASLRKKHF